MFRTSAGTRYPIARMFRSLLYICASFALTTQSFPEPPAQETTINLDQRIENERKILQTDPGNVEVRQDLAILLGQKKEYDEALSVLRPGLSMSPPPDKPWYRALYRTTLGELLEGKGDYTGAVAAYRECNVLSPGRCSRELTLALARTGDIQAAAKEYEGCGQGEDCGTLASGISEEPHGAQVLRQILAKHPHDLDAHWGLGLALKRKGELREAIYQFRAALPANGYGPTAHLEIAEALDKVSQIQEAIAEYRVVIRQAPNTDVAGAAQRALKRLSSH